MFIGKIKETDATRQFHGYVDKEASAKKVAHNVFKKGDKFFVSGLCELYIYILTLIKIRPFLLVAKRKNN